MAELIASEMIVSENNLKLQSTISSLLSDTNPISSLESIISKSPEMEQVKRRAFQVAHSDSTILITGESGTGKGLLARSIHRESDRADQPFVTVNCAAIPEMLLESELFGYEKGAFTGAEKDGKPGKFQLADKGTIFLDEIGDMPLHLQVKLLNCLQNKQVDPVGGSKPVDVDVRVIAATNKELEKMIEEKTFREDLYFRLNVIPIYLPPLRERREDVDILLDFALRKFNLRLNKRIIGFSEEARRVLNKYSWPGNVREIENAVEYAVNMEDGEYIKAGKDYLIKNKVINYEYPGDCVKLFGLLHKQKKVIKSKILEIKPNLVPENIRNEIKKAKEDNLISLKQETVNMI
ncbi:MAG: sigma 54-interacting transcriptional regulator, partial [Firmicutes bacterium]|nr:sigma 54-interacting transcriptional regulator [Bacillota bacterium]